MSEKDFGTAQTTAADLLDDERWALANRIAGSAGFSKAAQLRDLLLFICKHAITDPSVEMSEQEIGSRALGRRQDYDTQSDNIVRVQVRHLRQKLEEYFAAEGRDERMLISIPKGSRVPRFEARVVAVAEPASVAGAASRPPGEADKRTLRSRLLTLVLLGVVLAAGFFVGRYSAGWGTTVAGAGDNLSSHPLWARIFERNEQATVVISDSSLAFVQDMLRANLSVDDLSKGAPRNLIERLPEDALREVLREITVRQYTSMADATVASRLATVGSAMGSRVAVRYSRHMGIRDFNAGNFVLVGSRRGIPWVELFEPELNFRLDNGGGNRQFGFLNKHPLQGESATYTTARSADGRYETYAVIAFVANLKRSGAALLLEGIMMEGTEAAGEFATSNAFARMLVDKFGATPTRLPPFEVLLKIQAMSGAPNKVDVVAWRRPEAR